MRKSIDGLAAIVQQQFHLDPLICAEIVRQYCDKLFAIEDRLKDLSPEEQYQEASGTRKTGS